MSWSLQDKDTRAWKLKVERVRIWLYVGGVPETVICVVGRSKVA